jgi:flagellar operon protein
MNRIQNQNLPPIDPGLGRAWDVGRTRRGTDAVRSGGNTGPGGFRDILSEEIGRGKALRFSAHAQSRLESRKIDLGPEAMDRLNHAVERAAAKGARDALLLMPGAEGGTDLALIVSVTNRTVVTAVDGDHLRDNVFTNIDTAMVVR